MQRHSRLASLAIRARWSLYMLCTYVVMTWHSMAHMKLSIGGELGDVEVIRLCFGRSLWLHLENWLEEAWRSCWRSVKRPLQYFQWERRLIWARKVTGEGEMDARENFGRRIQLDLVIAGLQGLRERRGSVMTEWVSSVLIGAPLWARGFHHGFTWNSLISVLAEARETQPHAMFYIVWYLEKNWQPSTFL